MKFVNAFNYQITEGILDELPTKTIPNQSIPVKDLVKRFANNQPLGGNYRQPLYEGDLAPLGVPFESLDLTERNEIEQIYRQRLSEFNDKYQQSIEDNYKLKLLKDVEKIHSEQQQQQQQQKPNKGADEA